MTLRGQFRYRWTPKRPKDSFGPCSTALSQLGTKWHGVPPPHVCSRIGK